MTMAAKRMSYTSLPKKNSSAHFTRACPISAHFAAIYMKSSDEQLYGRREHLATHFPFFSSKYQIALSNLVSNLVPEYVSWPVPRYIFFKPNNLEQSRDDYRSTRCRFLGDVLAVIDIVLP